MTVMAAAQARRRPTARPIKLVALGDSLTAGYSLPASAAFPVKLQKALQAKGIAVEIGNAGVSGDTSSGGLARLDWSIAKDTEGVILELGANDALRGLDPQVTRNALEEILKRMKARNIPVLLCGMYAPPNYGQDYAAKFNAIYPDLAKQVWRAAVSVLPRRRCHGAAADPAGRAASDCGGHRRHRHQHPAHASRHSCGRSTGKGAEKPAKPVTTSGIHRVFRYRTSPCYISAVRFVCR